MRTQIEGWGWTLGWTPTSPLANSPVGFSGSQVAFVDRGAVLTAQDITISTLACGYESKTPAHAVYNKEASKSRLNH
jgi:hypothetical protein